VPWIHNDILSPQIPRSKTSGKAGYKPEASVTIQLPLYNELYVVERLIQTVCEIDYPKDKLEIQVLDDSTDETSR
jgi:cellulose synthase/poly-beta-1,6-N-acetylglucosamine synthase-like glycosyltransferase